MRVDHQGTMASTQCRNVTINGRRTSLRMELVHWSALEEIAEREQLAVQEICALVDSKRGLSGLTAAIRIFILSYYRAAAAAAPVVPMIDRALIAFGGGPRRGGGGRAANSR